MTEEIINSDGSRNWQANILLDNVKRLEQDIKQLTQWLDESRNNADFWCNKCTSLEQERDELKKACEKCKLFDIEKTNRDLLERIEKLEQENKELKEFKKEVLKPVFLPNIEEEVTNKYRSALEEIRGKVNQSYQMADRHIVLNIVNEVLEC